MDTRHIQTIFNAMGQLVFAVLTVLLASGLCSGTEAALFSVPVVRVRQLAQSHRASALTLLHIRENMSRPIATVVILNNIANIVGSITVGGIATSVLGDRWLGVFSGVLTFLVIVLSEIIPKTLGERYSEEVALSAARPVRVLTYLMTPLVWLVEWVTSPITRGRPFPTTNEAEIKMLTQIGQQEGIIEREESEMIQRVFQLNDVTAANLMTPRVAITSIHGDDSLHDAQEGVVASPHSRIVVTGESPDDVYGIALKSELLTAIVAGKGTAPVADFVRDVQFIPPNVPADRLLQVFQRSRQHLAIVIDEFGGVAGVVTLEDVLETLTGEIVDETDRIVDLRAAARRRGRETLSNDTPTGSDTPE